MDCPLVLKLQFYLTQTVVVLNNSENKSYKTEIKINQSQVKTIKYKYKVKNATTTKI